MICPYNISNKLKSQLNNFFFCILFCVNVDFSLREFRVVWGRKCNFVYFWVIFRYRCVKFWDLSRLLQLFGAQKIKRKLYKFHYRNILLFFPKSLHLIQSTTMRCNVLHGVVIRNCVKNVY